MGGMEVLRSDAVRLCQSIGYKMAKDWDDQKLKEKLVGVVKNFSKGGPFSIEDIDLSDEEVELVRNLVDSKGKFTLVSDKKKEGSVAKNEAVAKEDEAGADGGDKEVVVKRGRDEVKPEEVKMRVKRGMTRVESVCKAFKAIKKGQGLDDVAKMANEMYVKAGGRDSLKQSRIIVDHILPAAVEFGVVRKARVELSPVGADGDESD